ncbi:eCIS core domain-containing protein [Draconibacterium halophilum]|uniref:DUF4157 domain-containing protein n=1 Tax=Draconibacterium halophilum TaxID=2706887 RepID=A0A6C0RG24_9BACT|nr:DUF4157 domain-containing protein [Draconibacterium halophilum]QIA08473.1 DUF4157 domain-containing protein [Draconibacterium halophilum]
MKTSVRKYRGYGRSQRPFFAVQPKLKVGQVGDKYEQEADNIADAVVDRNTEIGNADGDRQVQNNTLSESISPLVQHDLEELGQAQNSVMEEEEALQTQAVEEEEEALQMQSEEDEEMVQTQIEEEEEPLQMQVEEEEEEPVQMQVESEEEEVMMPKLEGKSVTDSSSNVETGLKQNNSNGKPMDNPIQAEMESGFGADFSSVRIHDDSNAAKLNQQMGAKAFTNGKDIYFNDGNYNPASEEGKHLLAHELAHTIQQTGYVKPNLQMAMDDNRDLVADRFSGNRTLEACLDGERRLGYGYSGRPVSLIQRALVDAGFPLPVHGVDGIFRSETRATVQRFQRSSSLPETGVIDARTMSALDGLFSWGSPSLPTGTPGTVAPSITSETINIAPDGSADNRTTVGVGEFVRFTGNTEGTWSATSGRIIGLNSGQNMVWEAPATPSISIISLTNQAGTANIIFSTLPPRGISLQRSNILPIPAGTLGAAMEANITVLPLNVNLGRTQWFEEPGPATSVSGYFTRFSAADLHHDPTAHYLPVDDMNRGLVDEAAWRGGNPPFADGYHEWVIPNKYKIDGEPDARGRVFTNVTQSFFVTSTGNFMVAKAGAFIFRTINNFTF